MDDLMDIENPYIALAINRHRFFAGPTPIEDMSVNTMRKILTDARLLELNSKKTLDNF